MYEIRLENENDTIGNLISKELLKNPQVTYAAYQKKHPFDQEIYILFETNQDPEKIFLQTLSDLIIIVKNLQSQLPSNIE